MRSDRTTLYLRGVPRQIVGEVKAAAARRGTTLTALVTEAMAQFVTPQAMAGRNASPLDKDFVWYEAHRQQLCRRYEGFYVAIVNGGVIDHDRDFAALAERTFDREGMRPVLMPKVTRGESTVRVRSPRRPHA